MAAGKATKPPTKIMTPTSIPNVVAMTSGPGVGGTSVCVIAPPAVAGAALDALLQQRQVQVQRFETDAYRAKVSPSEASPSGTNSGV